MTRLQTLLIGVAAAGLAGVLALRVRAAHVSSRRSARGDVLMGDVPAYDVLSGILMGPLFRAIAADVAANAPPGGRVLEVGCGPGHLATRLARDHQLDVTGVDLDPAMVARANANADRALGVGAPEPTFLVADVAAMPMPEDAFDLVVSTFSMHHWSDPTGGLDEIARVLRPGGKALIWDLRPGMLPFFHAAVPHATDRRSDSALGVATSRPWRWPFGLALAARLEFEPGRPEPVAHSGA